MVGLDSKNERIALGTGVPAVAFESEGLSRQETATVELAVPFRGARRAGGASAAVL
jgi:hypothetical protein